MNSPQNNDSYHDLSTLAWVQEELRKSLETAHKTLRRYLRDLHHQAGSDLDALDPVGLRMARIHIHQSVGALELVNLSAGATLLRASENALLYFSSRPHKLDTHAIDTIEKASFGLLDYIARLLAHKPISPIALFPQYQTVQLLAGIDRAHPADLWLHDWRWKECPLPLDFTERAADSQTLNEFESRLLAVMRRPNSATLHSIAQLCCQLATSQTGQMATLWKLAAAFFEGQATERIPRDVYTKRTASRLLAQLRAQVSGVHESPQRLAQDLLFFCALARPAAVVDTTPSILDSIQATYQVGNELPVDYTDAQLGRYDPSLVQQARKRVTVAKDVWSNAVSGELPRLSSMIEPFSLVADSLTELYPEGQRLAHTLQNIATQTVQSKAPPSPALAMEVATCLLYLEASLEEGDFHLPEHAQRVQRLAERIELASQNDQVPPLEGWMEKLYRRVSDRQTLGSVVQELRANLSEAEQRMDQFFRQPADAESLVAVPGQLQAMRGVLAVLDLVHASQAIARMCDDIDHLLGGHLTTDEAARQGVFDRLASNLGALGFLIDMLSVQPHLAKSLFIFDPALGLLQSTIQRQEKTNPMTLGASQAGEAATLTFMQAPILIEQAQSVAEAANSVTTPLSEVSLSLERLSHQEGLNAQTELNAALSTAQAALEQASQPGVDSETESHAREQVAQAMADFVISLSDASTLDELKPSVPSNVQPPLAPSEPTPVVDTGLEEDDEMREIFLEEAREVIVNGQEALALLASDSSNIEQMTIVRRAFHTLKGSSRMVGLKDFGEASWACEQLYNTWLASHQPVSEDLAAFTAEALYSLQAWTDEIAANTSTAGRLEALRSSADALRLEGRYIPLTSATSAAPSSSDLATDDKTSAVNNAALEVTELSAAELTLDGNATPAVTLTPSAEVVSPEAVNEFVSTTPDVLAPIDEPTLLSFSTVPAEDNLPALPFTPEFSLDLPTLASPAISDQDRLNTEQLTLPEHVAEELTLTDFSIAASSSLETTPDANDLAAAEAPAADTTSSYHPPLTELLSTISLDLDQADSTPGIDETVVIAESPAAADDGADLLAATELAETEPASSPAEEPTLEQPVSPELAYKVIGPLSISLPLFNIYATEAEDLSQRLVNQLNEWASERHHPIHDETIALAHSLAGNSATVGFHELSQLSRQLEHTLTRSQMLGHGTQAEAQLYNEIAAEIRQVLRHFAAGAFMPPDPTLLGQLTQQERDLTQQLELLSHSLANTLQDTDEADSSLDAPTVPLPLGPAEFRSAPTAAPASSHMLRGNFALYDGIDAIDAVDPDLFPIFEEEGQELLPQLAGEMRAWVANPADRALPTACMRTLHTFKGGARLAGAMRLGELAHRLESTIEKLITHHHVREAEIEELQIRADDLNVFFEELRQHDAQAYEQAIQQHELSSSEALVTQPIDIDILGAPPITAPSDNLAAAAEPDAVSELSTDSPIEWPSAMVVNAPASLAGPARTQAGLSHSAVRVRAQLLDRLVNQAGEVSISRSRLATEVTQFRTSMGDLTDNLDRLRQQLRDIELQAETQMSTRLEATRSIADNFDPLEFDRYTRFQEITRMMAESVNDVATVQRSLQRTLDVAEDQLAAQARLTRDMQDDLLRTRMVEFESLSERLYRLVRQAAKEAGKQIRIDIIGGSIEVDRSVLDRMIPSFEHLLRNCVAHGIETPEARLAAGKEPIGNIVVSLRQEGNEVSVEFRDDGAGLDLERIRAKAIAQNLLAPEAQPSATELASLVFMPGLSTVEQVTELAGRGIGMDVVRSEVNALGGRIETSTQAGQGTSFKLVLPLTTAVTQVVMLRCGDTRIAVPSYLIEIVRRARPEEVEQAYTSGQYAFNPEQQIPFFWLGALLHLSPRSQETGRTLHVIIVRSAAQRIALHVDEILGNQEVVVKNLGPQLSRLPGLAGMTLLASGTITLIYNPVALATVYGADARAQLETADIAFEAALDDNTTLTPQVALASAPKPEVNTALPLVLVVDDSLTVRRVTQRLLVREGYRVTLAKDGLEALERLAEERPMVVLSDIEMPRMDGFDLVRNIRADKNLVDLPVVMITSRIAQKHREYATQLGVQHYLGKPYSEEELLALISHYVTLAPTANLH